VQGFKVYKDSTLVETLGANVKTYTLTGLTKNTTYSYSVKAYNSAGESVATSISLKTKEKDSATKSTITSPLNGSTVEAGKSLTFTWKNNGATKEFLYITSYLNFRT
jgi:chitodextrinase